MSSEQTPRQLTFWLRDEVKDLERRTPLLPAQIKSLTERGHKVVVERSKGRCVPDSEYEKVGVQMVESGSWVNAPVDNIILGLKELPENSDPLHHTHVYFAHCYKYQGGWKELLKRFENGKGHLLDLEFLVDDNGRRVAAFGRSAGFIGMAAGLKTWVHQQNDPHAPMTPLNYYEDSDALVADLKKDLDSVLQSKGKSPKVLIIGALGRCGKGAVDFALRAGVANESIVQWDLEETKVGGPFPQILNHDVFVNCIYLNKPIPPFFTRQMLDSPNRTLSVVVDVSCDTSNPHNPIPIYNQGTTFAQPTIRVVESSSSVPLDVIAIDHLPSLVPLESSLEFSELLLSHLGECQQSPVWHRASTLFHSKMEEAKSPTQNATA